MRRRFDKTAQATKVAHALHDRAYKVLADTIEEEISNKYDYEIDNKGRRARPATIVQVRSKPIQPKRPITMRNGSLQSAVQVAH